MQGIVGNAITSSSSVSRFAQTRPLALLLPRVAAKLGSHSPLPRWESLGITTIRCQINQPPFNNYIHFLSNLIFTRWHDSCHSTASHFSVALCSQQGLLGWGRNILLTSSALLLHTLAWLLPRYWLSLPSGLTLIAAIEGLFGWGGEHSTCIIRFEALCSQQPFRGDWGGGRRGTFYLHHPLCKVATFFL